MKLCMFRAQECTKSSQLVREDNRKVLLRRGMVRQVVASGWLFSRRKCFCVTIGTMLTNQSLQFVPNHDRLELGRELAAFFTLAGKARIA